MISQQNSQPSSRKPFLSISQLVVSLSGLFISILGIALLVSAKRYLATGVTSVGSPQMIWFLVILAFSCIPSIVLSIRWLSGKEPPNAATESWFLPSSILLVIWVVLLVTSLRLIGNFSSSGWSFFLSVLAVILPLIWFVSFSLRKINVGSWKRIWGLVNGTTLLTLPVILVVEGLIFIIIIAAIGPSVDAQNGLNTILAQLNGLNSLSPEQSDLKLNQLTPNLTSPRAIFALVFSFCLLIPLVEELFKPLLLWGFAKRKPTPAQGFAIGIFCGASFALVESLFAMNTAGAVDFAILALGRAGTGLLHTFNAGMMGWALASTWQDGRASRLTLVYVGVVILHGVWNFFALMLGFVSLPVAVPQMINGLSAAIPWILGLLAFVMMWMLFSLNKHLRKSFQNPLSTAPETDKIQ
jgi:hypothetical protein